MNLESPLNSLSTLKTHKNTKFINNPKTELGNLILAISANKILRPYKMINRMIIPMGIIR